MKVTSHDIVIEYGGPERILVEIGMRTSAVEILIVWETLMGMMMMTCGTTFPLRTIISPEVSLVFGSRLLLAPFFNQILLG